MNMQQMTLEQRVNVALQPDTAITSADLAALIEESEAGIAKADQLWRTVDQTSPLDSVIMAATCAAEQLRLLLPKLQARYQEVHEQEEATAWLAAREAAWIAEHDALKRERDALAEELREVYPEAAGTIVDLFVRIDANDKVLAKLHQDRPAGVEQYLRSAELHARGLGNFAYNTPSLLASVILFDWDSGRQAWPPPRPSMASAFAAVEPPHNSHRFSGDWWKDNERRAAGQRVEQQRMAEHYAMLTRQQEERENAEARERFAASQRNR